MSTISTIYATGWLMHLPLAVRMPVRTPFSDVVGACLWAAWPIITLASIVRILADAAARNEVDK